MLRIKFKALTEGNLQLFDPILECMKEKYCTRPMLITLEIDDTIGALEQKIRLINVEEAPNE